MSIATKLKNYLDEEHVDYQEFQHPEAYTATEISEMQHIPGKQFAKCVILNVDSNPVVCVLSSDRMIDFDKLRNITRAENLELIKEEEMGRLFPDFEPGSEPPFGNLYGLPVYADKVLNENEEIVFNGGTFTDIVKIRWEDFVRLASPRISDFSKHV